MLGSFTIISQQINYAPNKDLTLYFANTFKESPIFSQPEHNLKSISVTYNNSCSLKS